MHNIIQYGATAGGDCTEALTRAIAAAEIDGGGTVHIPPGVFYFGTVELKSHVTLYLESGAVLKGTGCLKDYREIGYFHNELGEVVSMLYAKNAEQVRIQGEGTIDLNGNGFFDPSRPLIPEGMIGRMTDKQIAECTWHHDARVNQPIFFLRCTDISIEGVTLLNAPCWTVTFAECRRVTVRGVAIRNHPNVPNNDGLHFCASRDVIVTGCHMFCADDCIAVTSITDWNIPSENFVISDCVLQSYSKTIVLGYMHSVVRNVTINNCVIHESNRGIAIMSGAGSGLVERVTVSKCVIDTRVRAGNWWGNGEPVFIMAAYHHAYENPAPEKREINVRDIHLSSLVMKAENGAGVIGENDNIEDIRLRDVVFTPKDSENIALKGRIMDLAPAKQTETVPQDGHFYWLVVRDARNVRVDGATVKPYHGATPLAFMEEHALNAACVRK